MKLIINISEYDREWIKNTYGIPQDLDVAIARAIINGKVLPDKHGRLVDADAFKADYGMKDDCEDCEKEMRGKAKACAYDRIYSKMDFCDWLDDAVVVIESEDNE